MAIPGFQDIMLPFLQHISDGKDHALRDLIDTLAGEFRLADEERREPLPSGKQPIFNNRVGWARTHLKKAGLIDVPQRAVFRITPRGKQVLAEKPARIDIRLLNRFPEFVAFRTVAPKENDSAKASSHEDTSLEKSPEETIEFAYLEIRQDLAAELLTQVKNCSPEFFERLVVELLVKMGYGGSTKDAGRAIGRSGDEGIDGVIKEDKLGLDAVYIQAKKWEGTVSRPEIQKFVGALHGQKARKGIFITTSSFTKEARDYTKNVESRVVLIGGEELAQLMIDHNIGVSPTRVFELKKLDSDFFSEE